MHSAATFPAHRLVLEFAPAGVWSELSAADKTNISLLEALCSSVFVVSLGVALGANIFGFGCFIYCRVHSPI